ncbi:MAG TPA: type II CAAX endopeptidase family protein [Candidatus Angelobacter sp.]|nr:type II CAAX endopeptidase family protein [Candidatus Angelobacter sp.]
MQPPTTNPQPDDSLRFIFFNEREVRPGWRLLIFLALFVGLSFTLAALLRPLAGRLPQGLAASALILNEAMGFLSIVFVSWIMSRIERRNMGEYGLPLQQSRALSRFIRGYIFWGFLPLTVLLVVLRGLHKFYFGNLALHNGEIFYWAAMWGLLFILVGLTEEYTLRGYLLSTLAEGIGFWPAAIVLAALFALGHTFNPGESRIGILMTAFFAMFASVILRYTGNLWLAVGAHAGWDWGQSYFYGVNDSGLQLPGHLLSPHIEGPTWLNGGSTGPEGSILCLVLMVAMSALLGWLYKRSKEPALVFTNP